MNETLPIAEATEIAATPPQAAAAPVAKIGVLLVNLGTPDAADADSVRRYLKEFLSDPRVIENQGLAWKAILNGAILRFRPRRKARDYAKIWNRETNESPLKTITRSQAEKLGHTLEPLGSHLMVDWAMRYGNPSIAARLATSLRAVASASSSSRSIRSTARPPRRPSATRYFACSRVCATSRPSASRRPITTTRSISRRSAPH